LVGTPLQNYRMGPWGKCSLCGGQTRSVVSYAGVKRHLCLVHGAFRNQPGRSLTERYLRHQSDLVSRMNEPRYRLAEP
jgi:hypothetical protein